MKKKRVIKVFFIDSGKWIELVFSVLFLSRLLECLRNIYFETIIFRKYIHEVGQSWELHISARFQKQRPPFPD